MSNDLNLSFRKSWSSCARLLTEGRLPVPKQYRHGRGGLEIVARKKGKKGNKGAIVLHSTIFADCHGEFMGPKYSWNILE